MDIYQRNRHGERGPSFRLTETQVESLTGVLSRRGGYNNQLNGHVENWSVLNLWEQTVQYNRDDRPLGDTLRALYVLVNIFTAGIFALIDITVQAIRRQILWDNNATAFPPRVTYVPNGPPVPVVIQEECIRSIVTYLDSQGLLNRRGTSAPAQANPTGRAQRRVQRATRGPAQVRQRVANDLSRTGERLRRRAAQAEERTEREQARRREVQAPAQAVQAGRTALGLAPEQATFDEQVAQAERRTQRASRAVEQLDQEAQHVSRAQERLNQATQRHTRHVALAHRLVLGATRSQARVTRAHAQMAQSRVQAPLQTPVVAQVVSRLQLNSLDATLPVAQRAQ